MPERLHIDVDAKLGRRIRAGLAILDSDGIAFRQRRSELHRAFESPFWRLPEFVKVNYELRHVRRVTHTIYTRSGGHARPLSGRERPEVARTPAARGRPGQCHFKSSRWPVPF